MSSKFSLLCLFIAIFSMSVCADNWAILVAGSMGYQNYRHQADVCHAYQVLHYNGFPDDRIIVMMVDDIADNQLNPVKGNIINRPNGKNVYTGVNKNYTGMDVNPTNFLNVIKGNKTKNTPQVLESGPDDNVFIYFADHGGPGIICFPEDYLYAHDLMDALTYMYDNKMYKNLVFYVEACESGSMFNGLLPDNMDIYATTAATPFESSWAAYCQRTSGRNTCLGDVYSINWLENSDTFHIESESVEDQFEIDRIETKTSTVCQYGNITIAKAGLKDYLAYNQTGTSFGHTFDINTYQSHNSTIYSKSINAKKKQCFHKCKCHEIYSKQKKFIESYYEKLPLANNTCIGNVMINSRCIQKHIEFIEKNVGKLIPGIFYKLIRTRVTPLCYVNI